MWDAAGRPIFKAIQDFPFLAHKDTIRFGYDLDGNLDTVLNTKSQIYRVHDEYGRLVKESQGIRNLYLSMHPDTFFSTSAWHVYDRTGRRSRTYLGNTATVTNGVLTATDSITYGYDPNGNVTSIANTLWRLTSSESNPITWTYLYDFKNRLTDLLVPKSPSGSINLKWTYDSLDHISTYSGRPGVGAETLTRDLLGRVNVYAFGSTYGTDYYTFDGFGRLIFNDNVQDAGLTDSTSYEALGNRLADDTWTYTYDHNNRGLLKQKNKIGSLCQVDYTHDNDGNRKASKVVNGVYCPTVGTDTSHYDAAGRLMGRVVRRPYTGGEFRDTTSFWYDGLGRRIAMFSASTQSHADADGMWYYFWLSGQVAVKTYAADSVTSSLLNPHLQRINDSLWGMGEWYYYAPGTDNLLASWNSNNGTPGTANERRLFLRDYRGSVVQVTGVSGSNLPYAASAYSPFGIGVGPNADESATKPAYNSLESGAGLVYMRNRWYDPNTGRFMTPDPIGFAGGINMYAYAGNNPITFTDPFGLKVCFGADAEALRDSLENITDSELELEDGMAGERCLSDNVKPRSGTLSALAQVLQLLIRHRETISVNVVDSDYPPSSYVSGYVTLNLRNVGSVTYAKWQGTGDNRSCRGQEQFTFNGIMTHEVLGHGYYHLYEGFQRYESGPVDFENLYYSAKGLPERCRY